MKKELAPKDELNKLDAYSAEEIKEVSSKTFEQSPSNTFKRDGILTEKLIVNGVDTNTVLIPVPVPVRYINIQWYYIIMFKNNRSTI